MQRMWRRYLNRQHGAWDIIIDRLAKVALKEAAAAAERLLWQGMADAAVGLPVDVNTAGQKMQHGTALPGRPGRILAAGRSLGISPGSPLAGGSLAIPSRHPLRESLGCPASGAAGVPLRWLRHVLSDPAPVKGQCNTVAAKQIGEAYGTSLCAYITH